MKKTLIHLAVIAAISLPYSVHAQTTTPVDVQQQQVMGVNLTNVIVTGSSNDVNLKLRDYAMKNLVGNGTKSMQDMQRVAEDMTNVFFKDKGISLSRVYVPAQSLDEKNPELTLAVLDSKYGKIIVKGGENYSQSMIEKRLAIKSGDVLETKQLERGLLLLDDLPGIKLAGVEATSGSQLGETDYVINLENENKITGALLVDNQGSDSTGKNRYTAQFAWANPLGYGDEIELGITKSGKGLTSSRIAYNIPFSVGQSQGWKASLAASKVNYRLVDPALAVLDAYGTGSGFSGAITYPIIRSQTTNMGFSTQYNHQKLNDYIMGMELNDKTSDSFSVGLSGDTLRQSTSLGNTQYNWTVATTFGKLKIKNDISKLVDELGPKTYGNFSRINASGSIHQGLESIVSGLSVYSAVSGQYSNNNLDSSEKFVVSGPNGVRGYEQGLISGDQGIIMNNEVRYQLSGSKKVASFVYAFYDIGHAKIYAKPFVEDNNSQTIRAVGLGITAQHKNGVFLTASVSKGSGYKAFGATVDNKYAWLQLGYRF